jgi:dTDP-4-dehydrorhamnose 3,5-epimerase
MEYLKTCIDGVFIIKPKVIKDERGYFYESFSEKDFIENVGEVKFVQDNQSKSCYGVVRGLHFQNGEYAQSKLVRCVKGIILDVAVDLRKDSPTYGKHVSAMLSEDNYQQLFIPRGFAHGFSVLSEEAIVQYKCDNFYNKESENGINPFDEKLNIDWLIPNDKIILSEKDKGWKKLDLK